MRMKERRCHTDGADRFDGGTMDGLLVRANGDESMAAPSRMVP